MGTVEKSRCQLDSLLAGAHFSTRERVENAELEVEFEGKGQCAQYKNIGVQPKRCV